MKSHTSRVLCALLLLTISGTLQATSLAPIELQPLRLDDPDRPQDRIWYDLVRLSGERARAETNRDRVPVGDYYPYPLTDGEDLTLMVPRAFARPGDRWVELPGDAAGLWSFQLDGKPQNITVENCPPFFAFDDPENFFVPTEEMLESQHGLAPSR